MTLFAAVEGRPPFVMGSPSDTLVAVVKDPPAPFLRAGPLRPVIEGLLAKQLELRLTLDEARAALRAIRRGPLTVVGVGRKAVPITSRPGLAEPPQALGELEREHDQCKLLARVLGLSLASRRIGRSRWRQSGRQTAIVVPGTDAKGGTR